MYFIHLIGNLVGKRVCKRENVHFIKCNIFLKTLSQLGVSTMFTRNGDFGNMYRMFVSHYINSANHKAYVEVSEAGSEQPLETGGK